MSKLLVVVGSVNYDLVLRHDPLPLPGQTVVGAELIESCGGKGANQAVAAARWLRASAAVGVDVLFAGAVGDDLYGERQLAQLRADAVDVTHVHVAAGTATGLSTVWVDGDGENRILNAPGANLELSPERVAGVPVEDGSLLLVQNEVPPATLAAVVARAARAGTPVLWDPAPFAIGSTIPVSPADCSIITPNETEAEALLGRPPAARPEEDAAGLRDLGFPRVILTLGRSGVVVAGADGEVWREPAVAVDTVDTTAAGDAFCGALAASLVAGGDFRSAVRAGVRYAAASVTRAGAQTSLPIEIEPNA
ncbi:MAG: ribokinase [Thermoanaerobaculia bacterium]|nr:ribokinase [Thermoanaerobaculia bacterium]